MPLSEQGVPSPDYTGLANALGIDPSQLAGLTTGTPPAEPQVFMGYTRTRAVTATPIEGPGGRIIGKKPIVSTGRKANQVGITEALSLIYTDPAQRKAIAQRMVSAGLIPPSWTDQQLASAWSNAVKTAADIYATGKAMTPFDVLALQGQAPGGGGEGLSPKTIVQKQINISTPEEARALLRQSLAEHLGRAPSESELDDYQAQLNSAQRANPSVTTTRYSATGERINSTTSGGLNPQAFTEDYAHRQFGDEESDYEVVSNLMPTLFEALRTPV